MLLTCFTTAFERARQIYLTYLAMVTVLLTLTAKDFITNSFIAAGHTLNDYQGDAYNAAAAGAVLLCITNFALIIFVGLGAAGTPLGTGPGSNPPLSLQMGSSAPSAMEQKYAPSQYQPSNF
ncbi:hypothetical protein HYH03_002557 [Edaphochlamys debaryana]|uniref:Uncharacterized protein n=1 Tax=Edaphochlamys debaryana TaxID=47281 RepID=A0A836C552_9CHLO|nr:hypothetical protein HYH03_002557 [Edaphochlamys debaryana]|eukprot:KAG2499618.1 hypothetical protein HYH03_002557 [Edaphochlamys debaryana]